MAFDGGFQIWNAAPRRNCLWIGQNCCPTDWKAYHKGRIAFPKVQNASDLMTNAPSEVDIKQLMELHIAIEKSDENKDV